MLPQLESSQLFGSLFGVIASENAISKLYKKFKVAKKLRGVYVHNEDCRKNTVDALKSMTDIIVVDCDNNLGVLLGEQQLTELIELEKRNPYQFNQIYYLLVKKYYNAITKYYYNTYKRLVFLSSDYRLLQFLKLVDADKVIHAVNNKVVFDEMKINKKQVVLVNEKTLSSDWDKALGL